MSEKEAYNFFMNFRVNIYIYIATAKVVALGPTIEMQIMPPNAYHVQEGYAFFPVVKNLLYFSGIPSAIFLL